ncbi:deoxyribodipyrimidine photo-lyase [Vibrio gallicus]|uniref:deoxyribodipyrimidine photo-lyase n=1 Tax=Vibrio gallicus TaxID=190897 RepID=UPI0021C36589|nr:deoxyribodipyrimidine photo-lyase [Vibrio gallicus]
MNHIVWLRRDLRVIDNTALCCALQEAQKVEGCGVIAVFIETPNQWQQHAMAPIQADLIRRRLCELAQELEALHVGLIVTRSATYDQCPSVINRLCDEHQASTVWVNTEYEFNELKRDEAVAERLAGSTRRFISSHDRCVFKPGQVLNKKGDYFKVFTPFKKAWLNKLQQSSFQVLKPIKAACDTSVNKPSIDFNYPCQDSKQWTVSSRAILDKLRQFVADDAINYNQDRDFPAIAATSGLSPFLAIGALSTRQCVESMLQGRLVTELSQGEQTWLSELIWREFYQHLIAFLPSLNQGKSFAPWGRNMIWQGNSQHLAKWQQGRTGYPIVDAAMRQLNATGWMHNRLRMVTASFLTKDLLLNWRLGEAYFMHKLIDGDYASNNGGWQWSASTGCDAQPYFRIFNPISQGERFDPQGEFVRFWIPELSHVPNRYIHKPWLWAEFAGLDYPLPIVDHKTQRGKALEMYKEARSRAN